MNDLLWQTALVMGIGLLGAVLPMIPGPPLVFLGALWYAHQTGYEQVGWFSLAILLVLALVGSTADLWMSAFGAKKSGASIWSTVAATIGGVIGLMLLSLPGLFIGSLGAIVFFEYSRHKDWNKVRQAAKGYLVGYLLSIVVEIIVCLTMIGLFVAAVQF